MKLKKGKECIYWSLLCKKYDEICRYIVCIVVGGSKDCGKLYIVSSYRRSWIKNNIIEKCGIRFR